MNLYDLESTRQPQPLTRVCRVACGAADVKTALDGAERSVHGLAYVNAVGALGILAATDAGGADAPAANDVAAQVAAQLTAVEPVGEHARRTDAAGAHGIDRRRIGAETDAGKLCRDSHLDTLLPGFPSRLVRCGRDSADAVGARRDSRTSSRSLTVAARITVAVLIKYPNRYAVRQGHRLGRCLIGNARYGAGLGNPVRPVAVILPGGA